MYLSVCPHLVYIVYILCLSKSCLCLHLLSFFILFLYLCIFICVYFCLVNLMRLYILYICLSVCLVHLVFIIWLYIYCISCLSVCLPISFCDMSFYLSVIVWLSLSSLSICLFVPRSLYFLYFFVYVCSYITFSQLAKKAAWIF